MPINNLSVVITPEKDGIIQQLLDNLLSELDFLLILAIDDRMRLVKMGRRDVDFVYRGLKHALGTPVFLPSYVSLNVFKEDVDFSTWLRKVEKKLDLIAAKVKDTALVAEAEAYQSARLYYNSVKAAAKAGNEEAEKIAIELARHYKKKFIANDENPLKEEKKQ